MTALCFLGFFAVGSIFGSFLNVVIYRLPRGISILKPRSFCPRCGAAIGYKDLIPLVSYILLRGRCARCAWPIPWRYPFVELLSGVLLALAFSQFGATVEGVAASCFSLTLLAAGAVDAECGVIPDSLSAVLLVTASVAALLGGHGVAESLLGAAVGGGGLWIVGFAYKRLRHRPGIGFGDVKLAAGIGMILGVQGVLDAITVAALVGTAFSFVLLSTRRITRDSRIPFAPFLAFGATLELFFPHAIPLPWG